MSTANPSMAYGVTTVEVASAVAWALFNECIPVRGIAALPSSTEIDPDRSDHHPISPLERAVS